MLNLLSNLNTSLVSPQLAIITQLGLAGTWDTSGEMTQNGVLDILTDMYSKK